jgi:hypothetical protein
VPSELLLPGAEAMDLAAPLAHLREHGYAPLGPVITPDYLALLRERSDALMMGTAPNEGMFFQRDTETGRYEDLPYGRGWEGATLAYRKVEKLELDPRFFALLDNPLFERVARSLTDEEITLYRAVLFTKPAGGGTDLPFHQDDGLFWGIDRAPLIQIWVALDDAPLDGGCLEFLPGSHVAGRARPMGGVVRKEMLEESHAEERAVAVPAKAGDAIVIHNHVWHRSHRSKTGAVRRGFTACYLTESTKCLRTKKAPRVFPPVFRR